MGDLSGYINSQQAADYLGVTRQRIDQMAQEGKIGTRVAGRYVFTYEELEPYKEGASTGRPRKSGGLFGGRK